MGTFANGFHCYVSLPPHKKKKNGRLLAEIGIFVSPILWRRFFVPDQRPTVNSPVCLTTVGAKANVLLYVG